MRTNYGKLVRDLIPEIIQADGKACGVKTLEDAAYLLALKAKLVEEATEANSSESTEDLISELADLYEVLEALQLATGISPAVIEAIRLKRRENRGGFTRRLYLEWVEDSSSGNNGQA